MRIGIFEGKKANYNRQILKLLIEKEPMKAWQIAKIIAKGQMDRTQDIYATLIRRNGRLDELTEKQYVTRLDDGRYYATFKGIIVYLLTEENPKIASFYDDLLSKMEFPETLDFSLLNISIEMTKEFVEMVRKIPITEFSMFKELIKKSLSWFDLDTITNEELAFILTLRLEKKLLKEVVNLLSKFGKNEGS